MCVDANTSAVLERLLPLRGPERPCVFALIAFELVSYPEQRAVDHGAIVAGQVYDPGLDDEAAEFDQMPRPLAALDLPGAHVMPRPRSHQAGFFVSGCNGRLISREDRTERPIERTFWPQARGPPRRGLRSTWANLE